MNQTARQSRKTTGPTAENRTTDLSIYLSISLDECRAVWVTEGPVQCGSLSCVNVPAVFKSPRVVLALLVFPGDPFCTVLGVCMRWTSLVFLYHAPMKLKMLFFLPFERRHESREGMWSQRRTMPSNPSRPDMRVQRNPKLYAEADRSEHSHDLQTILQGRKGLAATRRHCLFFFVSFLPMREWRSRKEAMT